MMSFLSIKRIQKRGIWKGRHFFYYEFHMKRAGVIHFTLLAFIGFLSKYCLKQCSKLLGEMSIFNKLQAYEII